VKDVLALAPEIELKGLAHITGGGIPGNLARALPQGCRAVLFERSWRRPPIFDLIAALGDVDRDEMFSTFNMGLGMIAVVDQQSTAAVLKLLEQRKLPAWEVGQIEDSAGEPTAQIVP
jgi:phosphoribosylformylglycinamidine cyclo-ligase